MKITKVFNSFFESEKAGGLTLILCTIASIALANSYLSTKYVSFWHTQIGAHSLEIWINDGLMALFFLLIGLELERELYDGELSKIRNAMLPFFGAIGGMIVPALLYLSLNFGTQTQSGFGIPMATDIAFAIGILSLLGNRVPTSLKVFLTALAVIDDLGAILVIAIFYTKTIFWSNLAIVLLLLAFLFILNRLKVYNLVPYLIGGIFMWYFMMHSGIHATITGVLLAFVIPFGSGSEKSPSIILQNFLHKLTAFFVLPLFALANTAIVINSDWHYTLSQSYTLGIALGLLLGKPIGIWFFSYLSVRLKISKLPYDISWKTLFGVSILGGIGFTMSIFVALLAFEDEIHINNSKIIILSASLLAGLVGLLILKFTLKAKKN